MRQLRSLPTSWAQRWRRAWNQRTTVRTRISTSSRWSTRRFFAKPPADVQPPKATPGGTAHTGFGPGSGCCFACRCAEAAIRECLAEAAHHTVKWSGCSYCPARAIGEQAMTTTTSPHPEQGQMVSVRSRNWMVTDVPPARCRPNEATSKPGRGARGHSDHCLSVRTSWKVGEKPSPASCNPYFLW